jgi:ribosomal protein S11
MLNSINTSFDLNKFLSHLSKKKQYSNQLKKQTKFLNKIKETNYKILSFKLNEKQLNNLLIMYVLNVHFSRSNTLLSVMDSLGNTKFSYSAGVFNFKGRQKISRSGILKNFYTILVSKLKFLKDKPVAVHFTNVGFKNFWFLKKLQQKFFVVSVRNFNFHTYNGCRRKKVRRKMKKWLSGLKRQTVNLLRFSHRRFESCFLQNNVFFRNIT